MKRKSEDESESSGLSDGDAVQDSAAQAVKKGKSKDHNQVPQQDIHQDCSTAQQQDQGQSQVFLEDTVNKGVVDNQKSPSAGQQPQCSEELSDQERKSDDDFGQDDAPQALKKSLLQVPHQVRVKERDGAQQLLPKYSQEPPVQKNPGGSVQAAASIVEHGAQLLKCKKCPYESERLMVMITHESCHGADKKLKCTSCDFSTNKEQTLNLHMRLHFEESKRFQKKKSQEILDREVASIHSKMEQLAAGKNLGPTVVPKAKALFQIILDKDFLLRITEKHDADNLLPSLLYTACREEDETRTLKVFVTGSNNTKAGIKKIKSCIELIVELLELKQDPLTAIVFMSTLCADLGVSRLVKETASHIACQVTSLDYIGGRKPIAVAATSIFMAAKALQIKVTQTKIAAVAGITPVTIREIYSAMIPRVEELFPADFSRALIALLPE